MKKFKSLDDVFFKIDSFLDENKIPEVFIPKNDLLSYLYLGSSYQMIFDEPICFFTLFGIEVQKDKRGRGIFKKILSKMESTGLPILIDDIVSPCLDKFLDDNGYLLHIRKKCDEMTGKDFIDIYSRYYLGGF